jgi:hypothetical protein
LIQNEEHEINVYMLFTWKELEDKRKEGNNPNTHDQKDEALQGEMDKGGEEEANEKEVVDQEKENEEEREEQKPESRAITGEDDKGEPKGYSGPVSTSTIDCRLEENRWSHLKDVIQTYRLNLSTMYTDRRKEEDAEAETEDANAKRRLENFLANPHFESERLPGYEKAIEEATPDGTVAMIYVVLPEVPHPQPAKEAHLYLLPAKDLGMGNHSGVYNAEFE